MCAWTLLLPHTRRRRVPPRMRLSPTSAGSRARARRLRCQPRGRPSRLQLGRGPRPQRQPSRTHLLRPRVGPRESRWLCLGLKAHRRLLRGEGLGAAARERLLQSFGVRATAGRACPPLAPACCSKVARCSAAATGVPPTTRTSSCSATPAPPSRAASPSRPASPATRSSSIERALRPFAAAPDLTLERAESTRDTVRRCDESVSAASSR